MSGSKKNDLLPLLTMLESLGKIEIYAKGFTDATRFFIQDDQAKFNASLLLLMNVGEQSFKLSSELKSKYANLPLQQIRGLRNRIAHNYTGIDYEMVFDIVTNDVPFIKAQLTELLSLELSAGTFDVNELMAARQSTFYRHIDFDEFV